jgi:hypothetical protein
MISAPVMIAARDQVVHDYNLHLMCQQEWLLSVLLANQISTNKSMNFKIIKKFEQLKVI